jgi:o-succinylbenzoate synthase
VEIVVVELRRIRMPLVTPFRSALGTETVRDALLVRVETPDGEGWGECVAMATPRYSPEYVDGAEHVVRHHLAPALLAGVGPAQAPVAGHPMAKAAVEMAVLDAELRAKGRSLASHLGGVRIAVDAGIAIGMTSSVAELLDAVTAAVDARYRRVKLKIEPGWDVEPVRAVRERFPELPLQVDANGAYSAGDAAVLAGLDPFGLLLIEQPLPADDLPGHAALAAAIATPVCLDESITSARVAADAIAMGACSVVNVKAGRVGGLAEARRVHDVCLAAGVPVWCGGMLETGLGRAANAALASLPGFTLPGDLSASDRYYATDLTEPFVLDGEGRLAVPTGPGLGVAPRPDVLAAVTTSIDVVRR